MILQQIPAPLEGLLIDLELLRSRAELPPLFDKEATVISFYSGMLIRVPKHTKTALNREVFLLAICSAPGCMDVAGQHVSSTVSSTTPLALVLEAVAVVLILPTALLVIQQLPNLVAPRTYARRLRSRDLR
jgi:hypothetical protein